MQPEDVYELTGVAGPRLSPDGSRVAYHVWTIDREANEYRGAIWVAKLDGSEEPRRFTTGEKRDGGQCWSPDGRWLAFVSNRGGEKEQAQLYVIPAEGGEARKLTSLKESVEEIAWAPDSKRIAFTARVRDEAYEEEDDRKRKPRRVTRLFYKLDSVGWTTDRRRHLHVVDIDGGEPRQLTSGDCEDGSPAWSPDGKQVVFSALRGELWDTTLVGRLYVVDAEGGEPQVMTDAPGSFDQPVFSPDGSRLAYHFHARRRNFPAPRPGGRDERGRDWRDAADDLSTGSALPIPTPASRFGTATGSSSASRTAATCTSTPSPPTARRRPSCFSAASTRSRATTSAPDSSRTRPRRTRRCASCTPGRTDAG